MEFLVWFSSGRWLMLALLQDPLIGEQMLFYHTVETCSPGVGLQSPVG